jgi:hypothetical protein
MANIPRRAMGDFVQAQFPEPNNPIWRPNWDPSNATGMGDFVPANFPEPNNPIWRPAGLSGCACGSGMGAVAVPTWAATLPAPLNGVDPVFSVPWVYWGIGGVGALIILPLAFGKKGRR